MPEKKFSYVRSLVSFFYILLAGQLLLAIILYTLVYLDYFELFPWKYSSGTIIIGGIALSIICRFAAMYLYKQKLEEIVQSDNSIKKKLEDYMTANIQRWAIMEFAILTCIILIYLSGSMFLLVTVFVLIFLFLITWPGKKRIISELEIEL